MTYRAEKLTMHGRVLTRRRLFGTVAASAVALPAGRIGWLRLQDNPLPPVAEPHVVVRNGWVFDAGDIEGGAAR